MQREVSNSGFHEAALCWLSRGARRSPSLYELMAGQQDSYTGHSFKMVHN